jgi:hypothetical protein
MGISQCATEPLHPKQQWQYLTPGSRLSVALRERIAPQDVTFPTASTPAVPEQRAVAGSQVVGALGQGYLGSERFAEHLCYAPDRYHGTLMTITR